MYKGWAFLALALRPVIHCAYEYDHTINCACIKQQLYKIMTMNMFLVQGKAKPDRKYKMLKLGSGQAYGCSSD
jgi:hypothetical protein